MMTSSSLTPVARIHYRLQVPKLDCQFCLSDNGILALFGDSGAGKSTLLQCMAGFSRPIYAYFKLGSTLLDRSDAGLCLPANQRRIGYVRQAEPLFPHYRVEGNLHYAYARHHLADIQFDWDDVIQACGVGSLLKQFPNTLSGGQKQRVVLARTLLSQPRLLLLDEPFSALDFAAKSKLLGYLKSINLSLKLPMLYVSHDIDEVLFLGSQMLLIHKGSIIASGDPVQLCVQQPSLIAKLGMSSLLSGTLIGVDTEYQLTQVQVEGQRLTLMGCHWGSAAKVNLLIKAQDVSLSLKRAQDSSILNIFPVRIECLQALEDGQQKVYCRLGSSTLLALLTKKSVQQLALRPGSYAFAQIKTPTLAFPALN